MFKNKCRVKKSYYVLDTELLFTSDGYPKTQKGSTDITGFEHRLSEQLV
jgi:hypothetical protein